jgi:hypothetical protein
MKLRRSGDEPDPPRLVGDHADKLSRVPALAHDDDERPSREDLDYGGTLFNRSPIPLPRFLTGKKRRDAG